jgi:hypothetical protein
MEEGATVAPQEGRGGTWTGPTHHARKNRGGKAGLEWTSNHQCTSWGWGRWSRFGDEPKTNPPCPQVLFFSASYLPQNFPLLPTSLPPTSALLFTSPPSYHPPPTSHLPPPSYMPPPTSHSIARAREQSSMSGRGGTFGAGTPAIVGVGAPAIVGAGVPATIVVGAELPLLELERLPLLELKCLKQDPHET